MHGLFIIIWLSLKWKERKTLKNRSVSIVVKNVEFKYVEQNISFKMAAFISKYQTICHHIVL